MYRPVIDQVYMVHGESFDNILVASAGDYSDLHIRSPHRPIFVLDKRKLDGLTERASEVAGPWSRRRKITTCFQ